ncbi:phage major capsid protein [Rothia koreensis]|uniref:phage major capsid protein n=1 Tax=Rothia koreensis TaxID=592378 RepID=UPI0037C92A17
MPATETKAPWVEKLEKARDIAQTAETAARELTEDERKSISDLFQAAQGEKANASEQAKTKRDLEQVGELLKAEEAGELNEQALNGAKRGGSVKSQFKSLGERFTKSDEYQGLRDRYPNGIPSKSDLAMGQVQVPGGMKGLLTSSGQSDGDASTLITPDKLGLVPYPYVAPKLREVITNGTTGSDKIEYAQLVPTGEDGATNNAAGVKESPSTTGNVGVKPESELAFRKASAEVITVAHWMPVTRKTLSDASQIRTMIDSFLKQGLEEEIERLILSGDKDSPKGEEEWDGILNTTGLQDQAFDGDVVRTMRKAISKVTRRNGQVTAVLVSPELDEELDLLKDTTGRYLGAGPWQSGPATIWGRPRVVVPGLSGTGKFILGDLSTCVIWDREQATITATDSHADFFIRNLVAVLAEMRAGFGILNPSLLVAGPEAGAASGGGE